MPVQCLFEVLDLLVEVLDDLILLLEVAVELNDVGVLGLENQNLVLQLEDPLLGFAEGDVPARRGLVGNNWGKQLVM